MSLPHKVNSSQPASGPSPHLAPRVLSLTGVRLRRHADYQRAYAAARKHQSASMSWFLAPQAEPVQRQPIQGSRIQGPQIQGPQIQGPQIQGPRVGLTAGKVVGKAHERNRIKRRMREVLRRHVDQLPAGFDLVLHPRRSVLGIEFTKLEAEVLRILGQANAEAARTARPAAAQPIA